MRTAVDVPREPCERPFACESESEPEFESPESFGFFLSLFVGGESESEACARETGRDAVGSWIRFTEDVMPVSRNGSRDAGAIELGVCISST